MSTEYTPEDDEPTGEVVRLTKPLVDQIKRNRAERERAERRRKAAADSARARALMAERDPE